MTKEELIIEIRTAFNNVKLEDGVGLWEGQGIDDYADSKTMAELKSKDERDNWENIPYKDLTMCESSLSFFDAKGMRFCLPKFLIFDILADEVLEEQGLYAPSVVFTLSYNINEEYKKNSFSLLNNEQKQSIIHYLEFRLDEIKETFKEYSIKYCSSEETIFSDNNFIELNRAIIEWKQKMD